MEDWICDIKHIENGKIFSFLKDALETLSNTMLHLFQVNNLLTYNFVLSQDETAAMDYLENQEYQATLEYLVLGLLGKLGRLVRTVHVANLGQKVANFA